MIVKVIVGEDVKMADYLTLKEDGKLYVWKNNRNEIMLARAVHDGKAGETIDAVTPSFFEVDE